MFKKGKEAQFPQDEYRVVCPTINGWANVIDELQVKIRDTTTHNQHSPPPLPFPYLVHLQNTKPEHVSLSKRRVLPLESGLQLVVRR